MINNINSFSMSGGMIPRQEMMSIQKNIQPILLEKISAASGLSVEELQSSMETGSFRDMIQSTGLTREDMHQIRQEAAATAVEQGVISAEDAEKLGNARPPGPPPGPPPGDGMRMGGSRNSVDEIMTNLMEELELDTEEDLLSYLMESNSFSELLQKMGVLGNDSSGSLFDIFT
ncbi:MAG: hypothetical protein JEZ06_20765 [Anaerolineaceae bacterium]|nr:hypothetical protein [Anaerolineaceae bacterium]